MPQPFNGFGFSTPLRACSYSTEQTQTHLWIAYRPKSEKRRGTCTLPNFVSLASIGERAEERALEFNPRVCMTTLNCVRNSNKGLNKSR
jgi:hypothetical protein